MLNIGSCFPVGGLPECASYSPYRGLRETSSGLPGRVTLLWSFVRVARRTFRAPRESATLTIWRQPSRWTSTFRGIEFRDGFCGACQARRTGRVQTVSVLGLEFRDLKATCERGAPARVKQHSSRST